MPSINKLTNLIKTYFFMKNLSKIIEHEYTDERKLISKLITLNLKINFKILLDIRGNQLLFSNQNFEIEKNKIIGIKGESGSVKVLW